MINWSTSVANNQPEWISSIRSTSSEQTYIRTTFDTFASNMWLLSLPPDPVLLKGEWCPANSVVTWPDWKLFYRSIFRQLFLTFSFTVFTYFYVSLQSVYMLRERITLFKVYGPKPPTMAIISCIKAATYTPQLPLKFMQKENELHKY